MWAWKIAYEMSSLPELDQLDILELSRYKTFIAAASAKHNLTPTGQIETLKQHGKWLASLLK